MPSVTNPAIAGHDPQQGRLAIEERPVTPVGPVEPKEVELEDRRWSATAARWIAPAFASW